MRTNGAGLRALVVGGASGIGAATAAHFQRTGAEVLVADITPPSDASVNFVQCDLRNPASIDALLGTAGGGWDVLAHVAGLPGTRPARDVVAVNFLGMRRMVRGMLGQINPGGSIVVVASTAGMLWQHHTESLGTLLGIDDAAGLDAWLEAQGHALSAYNVSKEAAILAMKRLAPQAWSDLQIRINTVSPGPVDTPILGDFEKHMGKDFLDSVAATVGRHARVDDIVPVIAFLASPDARWIIGQDIHVDGGFTSSLISAAHSG
jgi:NAD(P)-dependent dehydrogenase (short-subunit alcohol dehydrogenase family)